MAYEYTRRDHVRKNNVPDRAKLQRAAMPRHMEDKMDSKLYIEWRDTLGKWIVKYQTQIVSQQDTQAAAERWVRIRYPGHGYEVERVVVRKNSPKGARHGEWR
jgi:hypothetical protein